MIVTVEISIYPLQENYEEAIVPFIQFLKTKTELKVFTNAMSTQVKGELGIVMQNIQEGLTQMYGKHGLSSTVIKLINKDLPIEAGHLSF